ncbi:DUF6502 family protein [Variovorax sp. J22P168]|uniref:DUF6502 family protein n=1 Tax=Variovorax jilinensis TaxID=3053513 RepID=UPI00257883BD|nr:DUF6502 family protein [Variovorax sp. J22P168]MDM0015482.1 DUF6502 family protein [Variovorax sp. J22P168]
MTNTAHKKPALRKREGLAQLRNGQLAWVLAACARVLRPLVRLCLAFGVKHAQLETLLRDIMVDEARRAWVEKGVEPNISQLSVTTGLNRKAVTLKVRAVAEEHLPHSEMSAESKTITLWLQAYADNPALKSLPIVPEREEPSFEALARFASRGNVHHRTILEELVRLKMVKESGDRAELATSSFVPANDQQKMLAFLGDNTRDHLLAAVSNTLGAKHPFLERSVFAGGITTADCVRIQQFVRERWNELHHAITHEMTSAYDAADKDATGRIRVGIYTYYEDAAGEAESPASEVKAPGKIQ